MPAATATAPEVLKLVGHDLRWRLVRVLAGGDRRVHELVDVVGEPQNLVSYHLRLLRRGRLVAERRSSADGRDVYYHLDLDRLDQRLHETAALVLEAPRKPLYIPSPGRVLFLCTGNSARSQMAEAILRHELGRDVDVRSAGPDPSGVHPLALETLAEMGITTGGLRSKGLEVMRGAHFDVVITLCDRARESCSADELGSRHIHWSLPDPAAVTGSAHRRRLAFRQCAEEITKRIRHLTPTLRSK